MAAQAQGASGSAFSSNPKSIQWLSFMQQQLQHLAVVNLEAIARIKYAYASNNGDQSTMAKILTSATGGGGAYNQLFTVSNEGYMDKLMAGAQQAGLLSP